MTILENLHRIRQSRGMSVYKLEKSAGISLGSIMKWENSIPGVDKLSKVASALGVSMRELLEGTEFEDTDLPRVPTDADIRAAFFAGTGLTQEEQAELWQDAREYAAFLAAKKRKK